MLKNYKFIIILLLVISLKSCKKNNDCFGEGTFYGNVKLTNQFQIDSFSQYKYSEIDGYFQITAFDNIDLSSLCSLNSVDRLSIFAKELNSLNGLNNIIEMDALRILGCDNLTSISEFKNLNKLNHLSISSCDNLESISSFSKVTSLINLELSNNEKLINFEGLSNLKRIYHTFIIANNNSIVNMSGFKSLRSVEEKFEILYNANLKSLNGLESLEYANNNALLWSCNNLTIAANAELKDFCALKKLVQLDCSDSPYNHPIYIIEDNAYNPSRAEIGYGECSIL